MPITTKLESDRLRLPNVPKERRAQVRKRVAPWIDAVVPEPTRCFKMSQIFVLAAKDPNIDYVEGVYGSLFDIRNTHNFQPEPHAWVTVDGHLVDFLVEWKLTQWPDCPADRMPEYEPLRSYPADDLKTWFAKYSKHRVTTDDSPFKEYSINSSIGYEISSFALPPPFVLNAIEIKEGVAFHIPRARLIERLRAKDAQQ